MNNLSWLLYAADVSSNFSVIGILFLILGGITAVVFCAVYFAHIVEKYNDAIRDWRWDRTKEPPTPHKIKFPFLWWFAPLWILILCFVMMVPSRNTILLIATSETVEEIVAAPEVSDLLQDSLALLRQQINKQLNPTE